MPNIAQCYQHIDLPTIELLISDVKLAPLDPGDRPGVQEDCLARNTNTGKILVNKERSMVAIKSAPSSDEGFHMFNPSRMIDQSLERLAGFVNLLQIQPFSVARKYVPMDVAGPLTGLQSAQLVKSGVRFPKVLGVKRIFDHQIPPKIEEIDIEIRYHFTSNFKS